MKKNNIKVVSLAELEKEIRNIKIDAMIAIDGDAASGKTTFANKLEDIAMLIHMDHFYKPICEQSNGIAGNIDFNKLINQVIIPFKEKQKVEYAWYDPHQDRIIKVFSIAYKPLLILEGAYSCHPLIAELIDLKICMKMDLGLQKKRIIKRSSFKVYEAFINKWILKELKYQEETKLLDRVDYIVHIKKI